MDTRNRGVSPIEVAAGAAGPHAVDAFELLSNETRLAILLALWEAYDPAAGENTVPFSALFERVSMRDTGTFSYHLEKLRGRFVAKTETGYRLRHAGHKLVQAIIAGSGLDQPELPPTDIPRSCDHCGAQVELSYKDERLYQICTECEGNVGPESMEGAPAGTLIVYDDFNPSGVATRDPEEAFVAATIEYLQTVKLLIRGVCPECSGPIEESLHLCESHDAPAGEFCEACGTSIQRGWNEARVRYVCSTCKYSGSYPAWTAVYDHPAVVAFYYEHGFDMTFGLDEATECGRAWELLRREQTLLSTDPVRIRVVAQCDGEELQLTLDEELAVTEVATADC